MPQNPAYADWSLGSFERLNDVNPLLAPGVEVCQRTKPDGTRICIVINHRNEAQTFKLPWSAREHLSEMDCSGELNLSAYGVAVLTRA